MKYTYLVDHGDNAPSVGAGLDIQGGNLVAVQFSDALEECDRLRTALEVAQDAMNERRGYAQGWEWKYGETWNEEDAKVAAALIPNINITAD